jgi:flagellar protein FliS
MYNPYGTYLESQVLSATPLQLVHLAYEGALEAVREARAHLSAGRIFDRSRAISKVQEILAELSRSLNFEAGGDLSSRLASLYDYMQRRLIEANGKQIEAPLEEVENLLATLSESWKEVAANETSTAAVAAAPGVVTSPWGMASEPSLYSRASYSL